MPHYGLPLNWINKVGESMVIYEGPGNIFESGLQTLVVPVNTVGVMGNGLALAFKNRYPGLFLSYWRACKDKRLKIGTLHVFQTDHDKKILCFPTKEDWRNPSKLEYIQLGLGALRDHHAELGIESLSFPMLGCGKGGLDYVNDGVQSTMRYMLNTWLPEHIDSEILTS
jgi:O-acetyl-ADP-ribose deacetylase (regulator of RNase III)